MSQLCTFKFAQIGIVIWTAVIGCAANHGCKNESPGSPTVILENAQGQEIRITVELASRSEERARGLMYRKYLDENAGMLFIYPAEGVHTFWMKNTLIPLDMIFIAADLRVVGTVKNAKPMSLQRLAVDTPSKFVLEVNAGFVDNHSIPEASRVKFAGIILER